MTHSMHAGHPEELPRRGHRLPEVQIGVIVENLNGSAAKRLDDLAAAEDVSNQWLRAQLQTALEELAAVQPLADDEVERIEDF